MPSSFCELAEVRGSLWRLLPHLRCDEVAIGGGLAMALHLEAAAGPVSSRRSIADVDLLAEQPKTLASSIAQQFLVSHYHSPLPNSRQFFVQIVDPIFRLRIDIFSDPLGYIAKARPLPTWDLPLAVLDANSLLDHKLHMLAAADSKRPVDEKHYLDALNLAELCGRKVPAISPDCLGKDVYCTDLHRQCRHCIARPNPAFPLSSKREIFDVLGYV